jgi:L-alanine-DL-glutamate epimerase-like enolase superfamily enzyme
MLIPMNIRKIEYFHVESLRKEPFVIATGSSSLAHNIIVKVKTDDATGIGNACPNSVTGETKESIISAIKTLSNSLVGEDALDVDWINFRMDSTLQENPAAKAGIDIALWDLKGKVEGVPVHRMMGESKKMMMTDMTIGIMSEDRAVKRAIRYKEKGFKALKVKIGLDKEQDVERIKAVRGAVGDDMIIRVDANQGYDVKSAIKVIDEIAPFDIEQIEQPVKWDDLDGLKEVKKNSSIPVTADESVKTREDALKVIKGKAAHNINIKLMKCGGITRALEINTVAQEGGLKTMVGCMGENRVSIAAGLHFALSQENVEYADLDSFFSLVDDKTDGGFVFKEGYLLPFDKSGFGVEVETDQDK